MWRRCSEYRAKSADGGGSAVRSMMTGSGSTAVVSSAMLRVSENGSDGASGGDGAVRSIVTGLSRAVAVVTSVILTRSGDGTDGADDEGGFMRLATVILCDADGGGKVIGPLENFADAEDEMLGPSPISALIILSYSSWAKFISTSRSSPGISLSDLLGCDSVAISPRPSVPMDLVSGSLSMEIGSRCLRADIVQCGTVVKWKE